MKIFGLTLGQFGTALLLAGCIAFVYTFAAIPHPVEVPKIVITPVPTPPPVVITSQPTPSTTKYICQATQVGGPAFNLFNVLPFAIIGVGTIVIIIGAVSGPNLNTTVSPLNTSMSTTASSLPVPFGIIGIIVAMGGVLIVLYIMAIVTGDVNDAIMLAAPNVSACICP